MKHIYLLFLGLILFNNQVFSQCQSNENKVDVVIIPDNYPTETTWDITQNGNILYSGGVEGGSFCIDTSLCLKFTIYDQFGDGMCCNYGNGSYTLLIDDVIYKQGGTFTTSESTLFNCPPGTSCNDPLIISEGSFTAPSTNSWYSFTPAATGMYAISTCGLSVCDTKLWVYETCNAMINNNDNLGTLFYDDNEGGCGLQANISAYFAAGVTYLIRVGYDINAVCASQSIDFTLSYTGPIVGCMDPSACNYNPLATISNGNCIYYPNPLCPGGPDLTILQNDIINTLQIRQEPATDCEVEEGCMNGYGMRTVLAFDTHIKNIGDEDYYIGTPENNPSQFSFTNCHGHAHYEGYADYILYKSTGGTIPIGHKNGFCVMDLECSDGGTAQYGCGNMGISKQCGDIYNSGLACQWIDITDVEPGEYIMAVKVNWDQSPDALGRYESNYDNNWAQVCINIIVDGNGNKGFEVLTDCQPYVDCAGVQFGNSELDCNGECGGSAVGGDLDNNQLVQTQDAAAYVNGVLTGTLAATTCNDISGDGIISVWDAGLANNCALYNPPGSSNCVFPNTTINATQLMQFGFIEVNNTEKYMDVYVKNPLNKIVAYEFNVSGIVISEVQNMIDPLYYPITPQFVPGGNKVIGISYLDSLIMKNSIPTKLVRIYYTEMTSPDICVSNVVHVLNDVYEPVFVTLVENCISMAGVEERGIPSFSLQPNPSNTQVSIKLNSRLDEHLSVSIVDALGRKVASKTLKEMETELTFDTSILQDGFYQVVFNSGMVRKSESLIIKH